MNTFDLPPYITTDDFNRAFLTFGQDVQGKWGGGYTQWFELDGLEDPAVTGCKAIEPYIVGDCDTLEECLIKLSAIYGARVKHG